MILNSANFYYMSRPTQQSDTNTLAVKGIDINGFDDVLATAVSSQSSSQIGAETVLEMGPLIETATTSNLNPHGAATSFSHNQIKRASDMAGVLMDTKKSFLLENNFLDINEEKPLSSHRVSRATHARAERVKVTLSLEYMMIERTVFQHYNDNPNSIRYPGVEGVYNPLQIVRNRRVRAKYREFPKPLAFKPTPLASTVFSNRKSKFIWSIELSELISDSSWRVNHIHELTKLSGEKWFPQERTHKKTYLKLKLTHEDIDDSDASSKRDSSGGDQASKEMKDTGRRDRLRNRVRRTLKYTTDSRSTVSSDSNDFIYRFNRKRSKDNKKEEEEIEIEDEKQEEVTQDASESTDALNNIKIKPLDSKRLTFDDLEIIELPLDVRESKDGKVSSLVDEQLKMIFEEEIYLENSTLIKLHFLQDIYPKLFQCNLHQIEKITKKLIPELNRSIIDINDDLIPNFEVLSTTAIGEIKRLVQTINEDYSIRIDNLLTGSDRLIGEINTSMTLELRKIDERIDKLNSSFFGGNFNMDELKISESGNYRVMYFLLENSIVILLRLIWVIVNIYKLFLWVLLTVWKILKFILF